MAKKSKRQASKNANLASEKPGADPLVAARPTGFNPDYHYVVKDITRVGILAGSFFVVLVALAIILHI